MIRYKKYLHPWDKGTSFETYVKYYIENTLVGSVVFMNTLLYCPRIKRNTEVDCIVFYKDTMFVLELKSSTTMLYGQSYNVRWQSVSGNKRTHIYNPVMQNYLHTRAIKNILRDYKGLKIIPYVAVPSGCHVDSDLDYLVYNLDNLIVSMLCDIDRNNKPISVENIKNIMKKIRRTMRYEQ